MFNTLGNLLHDPPAAVVAPDFENRRIVQLSGIAGTNPIPAEKTLDYSLFNPPVNAR
ncbi:MAG: hypothetical protein HY820_23370 [Acidobacteria bacterium]|nr:hypothetical protein [Acidobacteriota bacterium]